MRDDVTFDPIRLLHELGTAGVRYVVIGGVAARALGSPLTTIDLDVCYARDAANYGAVAAMLRAVNASLRGADPGLPFKVDAKTIEKGDSFTFDTDYGAFDILGTPAGTTGYDDLARNAQTVSLNGDSVLVASIDDLIRMKRAAGRAKDRAVMEELGALREELDNRR